jgi:hypothetical protein
LSANEITPPNNTRINFEAATAFVRKCVINKKPIRLTGGHKGSRVTLDAGWILIEQAWYPVAKK